MKFDSKGPSGIGCWLGPLEGAVMELLWGWPYSGKGYRTRDIIETLQRDGYPGRAYTTYTTTIYRLIEKGLLIRTGGGRGHDSFVRPSVPEKEFYSKSIRSVLVRLRSEDPRLVDSIYESLTSKGAKCDQRLSSTRGTSQET